jgi:nitrate reductase cytochrome c-type subunit
LEQRGRKKRWKQKKEVSSSLAVVLISAKAKEDRRRRRGKRKVREKGSKEEESGEHKLQSCPQCRCARRWVLGKPPLAGEKNIENFTSSPAEKSLLCLHHSLNTRTLSPHSISPGYLTPSTHLVSISSAKNTVQ